MNFNEAIAIIVLFVAIVVGLVAHAIVFDNRFNCRIGQSGWVMESGPLGFDVCKEIK